MLERTAPEQPSPQASAAAPPQEAFVQPPDLPADAASVQAPEQFRFKFSGDGAEYFRIWLTNMAFTVMSLGLYSAWAKVRRLEYVYRNTRLADAHFMYDAQPFAILRGRLIAAVLFVIYYFYTELPAWIALVVLALLACAFPYLMWSGLRFKANRARHRGLRFIFSGSLSEAYQMYLPLIAVIVGPTAVALATVGSVWEEGATALIGFGSLVMFVFLPWVHARLRRWITNHTWYGQSKFSIDVPTRKFYGLYIKTIFVAIGVGIVATSAGGLLYSLASMLIAGRPAPLNFAVFLISAGLTYSVVVPFFVAKLQNLTWQATRLEGVGFDCRLSAGALIWLTIKNLFLILVTLGLWRPFGWIRVMKMRIESVAWLGSAALLAAHQTQTKGSTAGSEAADFFGADFGL
ncbi:MAG: YjgN family protein [Burkholderiaceae bacterium]